MIPRYSRPDMVQIWEPQTRFRIWFEIEAHACDALAELGVIPKESAKAIWDKAGHVTFDVERIDAIERVTKHDVIASSPISPSSSGRIRASCIRA
jgi:Adenylosuccinate lyase